MTEYQESRCREGESGRERGRPREKQEAQWWEEYLGIVSLEKRTLCGYESVLAQIRY